MILIKNIGSSTPFTDKEEFKYIGSTSGKVYEIKDRDKSLWDELNFKPLAIDYIYGRITVDKFSQCSGSYFSVNTIMTAKSYKLKQNNKAVKSYAGKYAKNSIRPAPYFLSIWDFDESKADKLNSVVLIEIKNKFRGIFKVGELKFGELELKINGIPKIGVNYGWQSYLI